MPRRGTGAESRPLGLTCPGPEVPGGEGRGGGLIKGHFGL